MVNNIDSLVLCFDDTSRTIEIIPGLATTYEYTIINGPVGHDLTNDFNNIPGSPVIEAKPGITAGTYQIEVKATAVVKAAVTTLAGMAGMPGSVNGTGTSASFRNPFGVATDAAGNVYVADRLNHLIRKITPAGVVTTLAGMAGTTGSANGTGTAASFNTPTGVATDAAGNVYMADFGNHLIRKITPAGVVTTLAGMAGMPPGSVNGTGTAASFAKPTGVATDAAGNVYVADQVNQLIRKITPAGVVTTLASMAGTQGSANGTGTAASFDLPGGVATDAAGNVYVADSGNHLIRKITPAGVVTTLAGMAGTFGIANGIGTAASFDIPAGVATDAAGNVYVADFLNHLIRIITPAGVVTTLAGMATVQGSANGTGTSASFNFPGGVATDAAGNVYVADQFNHLIRKIDISGCMAFDTIVFIVLRTPLSVDLATTDTVFCAGEQLEINRRITFLPSDSSWVFDSIRCIMCDNGITEADFTSNDGDSTGTGMRRIIAPIDLPSDIDPYKLRIYAHTTGGQNCVDSLDFSFIVDPIPTFDYVNNIDSLVLCFDDTSRTIEIIPGLATTYEYTIINGPVGHDLTNDFNNIPGSPVIEAKPGITAGTYQIEVKATAVVKAAVTTLAGMAGTPGSANGTGTAASFDLPAGVATDAAGNVYVADFNSHLIRKITPAGVVTTLAGMAGTTGSANGTGTAASFNTPTGVATDAAGNVYVADFGNHLIRKITPAGVVTTLAGMAGMPPGSVNGTGTAASFAKPTGVATDAAGNVYVADQVNQLIRKITPAGVVTTLAGMAGTQGSANGTGTAASFDNPTGVATDAAGNVYVADSGNHLIRKITPAGVVTTLAGMTLMPGFANNTGTAASFAGPAGVATDAAGNVYVADAGTNLIRKIDISGCMAFDTIYFVIHPKPDLTITPVAPLCLSDSPVDLTLVNPPASGFGGFCANPCCPQVIDIEMVNILQIKFNFIDSVTADQFVDKYPEFTVQLDNGGFVSFTALASPNDSVRRYTSGLVVGSDIAMEHLPDIADIADAIACGIRIDTEPCPFDADVEVTPDADTVRYTFLRLVDGIAFQASHPTLTIEGRTLEFVRADSVLFGPVAGVILVYSYEGESIDDIQATRATRCLDYPAPIFDPLLWGIGKHCFDYKFESDHGCFCKEEICIEVQNSPLISGIDAYICMGDTVRLADFVDTSSMSSAITSIVWGTSPNNLPNLLEDDTEVIVVADITYFFEARVSSNPNCVDTASATFHVIDSLVITLENGDPLPTHFCVNDAPFVLKGVPGGGRFCIDKRNCPDSVFVTPVDPDKNDRLKVTFCFRVLGDAQDFSTTYPSLQINSLTYVFTHIRNDIIGFFCAEYNSGKLESQVLSSLYPTPDDFLQLVNCEMDDDVIFDPSEFGPGFHEVCYKLPNHGNCPDTICIIICVLDVPVITGRDTAICDGVKVNLNNFILEDISQFVLTYKDLNTNSFVDSFVSPSLTTTYLITSSYVTSTCMDTATVTITVNPQPNITGIDTEVCCEDSISLLDFIVGERIGGVRFGSDLGSYLYPISQHVQILSDTTFYIIDSVLSSGCFDTALVHITKNPLPDLVGSQGQPMPVVMTMCLGDTIDLDTTVMDANNLPGDIVFYLDRDFNFPLASTKVAPTDNTWYYMQKITDKGCTDDDSIHITVYPLPELNIVPQLTTSSVCIGHDDITDLQYTFSPVDGSIVYSYEYISGPGALNLFFIGDDPVLVPLQAPPVSGINNYIRATEFLPVGTHTVLVTATQEFGYGGSQTVISCTNTRLIQFFASDLIIVQKDEVFFCQGETFDLNTVIADSVQGLGKLYYFDDKNDSLILITTGPVVSLQGVYFYDVHDKNGGCPTRCIIPLWFYDQDGGDVSAPNGNKVIKQCVGGTLDLVLENEVAGKKWIICDETGLILALSDNIGANKGLPLDVSGFGPGTYFVTHISWVVAPTGLEVGKNVNDLEGCFDLSNNATLILEDLTIAADQTNPHICSGEATHTMRTVNFSPIATDISYSFELLASPVAGNFADFFSIVPDRSMTINDNAPLGTYSVKVTGHLAEFDCEDEVIVEFVVEDCNTRCDDLQFVILPADINAKEGSTATFTVDAIGINLTYQWQELINNLWVDIIGETSTDLVIDPVLPADDNRMFRVIISDDKGCVKISPKATLTVILAPDLTPILTVLPNTIIGLTCDMEVTAKIVELKGMATSGEIKVLIPKDPRLTFTFDSGLATIGAFSTPVDNADWTYNGSSFLFHEFTSTTVIPANGSSTIGFLACYDPENTKGSATTTVQIVEGSGGEIRFDNNTDAEVLEYTFN